MHVLFSQLLLVSCSSCPRAGSSKRLRALLEREGFDPTVNIDECLALLCKLTLRAVKCITYEVRTLTFSTSDFKLQGVINVSFSSNLMLFFVRADLSIHPFWRRSRPAQQLRILYVHSVIHIGVTGMIKAFASYPAPIVSFIGCENNDVPITVNLTMNNDGCDGIHHKCCQRGCLRGDAESTPFRWLRTF